MSEHYPNIRLRTPGSVILIRDGLGLFFFIDRYHGEIAGDVMRSLERYLQATGPSLGLYADDEGEWRKLNDAAWSRIQEELQHGAGASIHLADVSSRERRFKFKYFGRALDPTGEMIRWPGEVCAVEFWLPTELLEERGPGYARELALELAGPLPFCSGQGGLAFNGPLDVVGVRQHVRELCVRYPGIDIGDYNPLRLGTKVRGPAWLTFLGQPVLGELGGASGLRSRLHTPGTTVQEMSGDRAVVTLGTWPEAGDVEKGQELPAYRELARVLEPWRFQSPENYSGLFWSVEDRIRWERRFLD